MGWLLIHKFANSVAKDIWEKNSSAKLPSALHLRAKALLTIMQSTNLLEDLKIKGQPPNIRLHNLKGAKQTEWSVTIGLPWCITFEFKHSEFHNVKIENYHKG